MMLQLFLHPYRLVVILNTFTVVVIKSTLTIPSFYSVLNDDATSLSPSHYCHVDVEISKLFASMCCKPVTNSLSLILFESIGGY